MDYSHKTSISGASAGIWVPVNKMMFFSTSAVWTLTRVGAGKYTEVMSSPAAETDYVVIPCSRGCKLIGMDLVYEVASGPFTSITPVLYRTSNVNSAVPTVSTVFTGAVFAAGSTSGGKVRVANSAFGVAPIVGYPVIGSVVGAHENDPNDTGDYYPDTEDYIEIAIVNAGSSTITVHGAWLYGDKLI